jgi:hypothetical protein
MFLGPRLLILLIMGYLFIKFDDLQICLSGDRKDLDEIVFAIN